MWLPADNSINNDVTPCVQVNMMRYDNYCPGPMGGGAVIVRPLDWRVPLPRFVMSNCIFTNNTATVSALCVLDCLHECFMCPPQQLVLYVCGTVMQTCMSMHQHDSEEVIVGGRGTQTCTKTQLHNNAKGAELHNNAKGQSCSITLRGRGMQITLRGRAGSLGFEPRMIATSTYASVRMKGLGACMFFCVVSCVCARVMLAALWGHACGCQHQEC